MDKVNPDSNHLGAQGKFNPILDVDRSDLHEGELLRSAPFVDQHARAFALTLGLGPPSGVSIGRLSGAGALWDCVPHVCGGGGGCASGGVPLRAVPVLSWCGEVSLGGKQSSPIEEHPLASSPQGSSARKSYKQYICSDTIYTNRTGVDVRVNLRASSR